MKQDNPNNAACKLVEMAAELLRVAASMSTSKAAESAPKWITTKEALAEFDMGAAALTARSIRRSKRGRAVVWDREQIEQTIANDAKPAAPRLRKATPLKNEDPIDAMLRAGELRATRGGAQ